MTRTPEILLVIPVYNHGQTLRRVVEETLRIHSDILVVDDGSSDGGAETLDDLPVRLIRHETNRGKGAAIMTAVEEARRLGKSHIITIDADGQHFPTDIPAFIRAINETPGAVMVGARDFENSTAPGSSRFGRKFSNFWLRVQTGVKVSDVQCGFRAYPLALFDAITPKQTRYSFEVEVLVKGAWAGFTIMDVDVSVHYPPSDERVSHFKYIRDNLDLTLLNTKLTTRSFIPVPHRQYCEDEQGNVSPIHPMRSLRTLLEQEETPWALAVSGAIGMLLGTLPLIGFHSLSIVFLLGYFRLSKITGLAVSQLCIPPLVPALCIEVGHFIRHGRFLTDISLQTIGYEALDRIWEWVLGSLVVGPVLGILVGATIYFLSLSIRRKLRQTDSRQWTSKSNAPKLAHRLFYETIRFGGRSLGYLLLSFVVAFYTLIPSMRKKSRPYRERRFGKQSLLSEIMTCYRLHLSLGRVLVDRAAMGLGQGFTLDISEKDRETLLDIASQGTGMVLVTAHTGCWQMGMEALKNFDVPKAIVIFRDDGDVDNHYFEHDDNDEPPFTIIDPSEPLGGTMEMMDILRQGGVLCVMGDRTFRKTKNTVDVRLLNGTIELPVTPYMVASAMGAPLVTLFSLRTGPGRGRTFISRVIDIPADLGRNKQSYQPFAQIFADGLTRYAWKTPYQFFNFFNMWKDKA